MQKSGKLKYIKGPLDFPLSNEIKNQIRELEITGDKPQISIDDLQGFINIYKLTLPKSVVELPKELLDECKRLHTLSCTHAAYESIFTSQNTEKEKQLKSIKFPYDDNKYQPIIHNLYNIPGVHKMEDLSIEQQQKIIQETRTQQSGNIKEILADKNNDKYKWHFLYILDKLGYKKEQLGYSDADFKKGEENTPMRTIADKFISLLNQISGKKGFIMPYPVQIFTILRLAYETVIGNTVTTVSGFKKLEHRSIAEVKTGEGKSLIIAMTALLVASKGINVDIITPNIELARRDQEEYKKYFNLFGISSGVLYDLKTDFDVIEPTLKDKIRKQWGKMKCDTFNSDVFSNKIVYSTITNFEHVYLKELFSPHLLRCDGNGIKRKYSSVLIDEVDNLLIDQHIMPTTVYQQIETKCYDDIYTVVYQSQDESIHDIEQLLKYFFKDGGLFKRHVVKKMKLAAQKARAWENGIDYIVKQVKKEVTEKTSDEDDKNEKYKRKTVEVQEIVMIDKSTGYTLPKYQMDEYVHEMLQVKEGLSVRKPHIPYATINHTEFIKKYDWFVGITGTIGDENDLNFLKDEYNIEPFIVPPHFASKKILQERKRFINEYEFWNELIAEVESIQNEGRPVLIIVDTLKRLTQIRNLFDDCNVITGMNHEEDKQAIQTAGNPKIITVATIAAGRGIDIKVSEEVLKIGGLHVIIPYKLPSRRLFEQAVGRSGRQGQPGSTTIYYDDQEIYDPPKQSDHCIPILQKLQEKFTDDLKGIKDLEWVLKWEKKAEEDSYLKYRPTDEYPFGIEGKKFLELSKYYIANRELTVKDWLRYRARVHQMIKTSWAIFFNDTTQYLKRNILYRKREDLEKEINDQYNLFIKMLLESIPDQYESKTEYIKDIGKAIFKKENWRELIMKGIKVLGVNVVGMVVTAQFGPAAGIVYQLASGFILDMGFDIAQILMNGGKVDWKSFVACLKKRSKQLLVNAIFLLSLIQYPISFVIILVKQLMNCHN